MKVIDRGSGAPTGGADVRLGRAVGGAGDGDGVGGGLGVAGWATVGTTITGVGLGR